MIENVDRKAFEWAEELELRYKIHNYWKTEAEKEKLPWGYRETAKKLRCSLGKISSDFAFAEALKIFPDLKSFPSQTKARDTYKKMGEQADAIQAMKNMSPDEILRFNALKNGDKDVMKTMAQATKSPKDLPKAKHEDVTPEYTPSPGGSNIEQTGDSVPDVKSSAPEVIYAVEPLDTFLPKVPNATVGFIELDPPYAIDFNTNYGKISDITISATDWDVDTLYAFYSKTLPVLYKKMLDRSWILCWTGKEHWLRTNEIAATCGFEIQMPDIWEKPSGSTNTPKTNMVSNYEMFLLFRKGKATFNIPSMPSVLHFNSVPSSQRIHQWEKPLDMYTYLFNVFGRPNSIFLSPFAGSGNSMIAAGQNGMVPMGCDTEQKYVYKFYERYNNFFMKKG